MTTTEIINKYPELFGEPPYDIKQTLIPFGFECSEYWIPVLEKGFKEMAEIVRREKMDDYRIVQVKEKFAGLRIYSNYYTDELDNVIDKMEEEVSHICEKCGSTNGHLITRGWMSILCPDCFEEKYGETWSDKPDEEANW